MKKIYLLLLVFLPTLAFCQDYKEIDAFARSVKFTRNYKEAARKLAKPYQTEKEKARAIYTWISTNIRYDEKQEKAAQKNPTYRIGYSSEADLQQKRQEYIQEKIEHTLKKKKGVCQDYSWLFQAMLTEIGIECEFVSGYSRTSPSQMGRIPQRPGHAWNAAKIDGEWALFDLTWSTDMSAYGGNGFFMMSPEEFYKSHYPSNAEWLFIEPAPSLENWSNQMFWYKSYNRYKVENIEIDGKGHQHFEVPYNSELKITAILKPGQTLYALKRNSKKQIELTEKEAGTYILSPSEHRLRGSVLIGVLEGSKLAPLLEFKIK